MKPVRRSAAASAPLKAPTGIVGFDEITGGGLPRGRTTLLVGGPGSGKTILSLQFLVHGARDCQEPGIFIAFEETSARVVANASTFGWNLASLQRKKLRFLDAQPKADLLQSGDFDLGGMCAMLDAQIKIMGAKRIVFDAIDAVLALLPTVAAKRRELGRLHEWLTSRKLTGIIAAKADGEETRSIGQEPLRFMLFMVDCTVILNHSVAMGVSRRAIRVQKYRGSGFDEDESPFVIGKAGIEVPVALTLGLVATRVTSERVSSGMSRLDTMLGGGFFRGSSMLVTGSAGTGKTTLSGLFAEAACLRGERTLFVSFDSDGQEVIRNLASVAIRLARYVKDGSLRMISARAIAGSADTYLKRIKALAGEHDARCLVIDPVSTWSKSDHEQAAPSVADQLIDWSKRARITVVCTRLVDDLSSTAEGGPALQISSLVDTWIHLNYEVQGGERNRGLSVIKSRGTAHSNQVRELILGDAGVALADVNPAGEALMGTLRWQRERAIRVASEASIAAENAEDHRLKAEEAEIEGRVEALQADLASKRSERARLAKSASRKHEEASRAGTRLRELRGADSTVAEQE